MNPPNSQQCSIKQIEVTPPHNSILGARYWEADDVAHQDKRAIELIRKAAAQRYAPAENLMGYAYLEGLGVPQNRVQALRGINEQRTAAMPKRSTT